MKKDLVNSSFRISKKLKNRIQEDLDRPHAHAYERVGFILTKTHWIEEKAIILAYDYYSVDDGNYIEDEEVGARINSLAIKKAMELAFSKSCGIFHVHNHLHHGKPKESISDFEGIPPMMSSISRVNKNQLFGYLILSKDSALCKVNLSSEELFIEVESYSQVGYPMSFVYSGNSSGKSDCERQKRQSFLGENALFLMEKVRIGIIGYGGGGSHIGQQLAHIGFEDITVFDHDNFEESNINRLIGSKSQDIEKGTPKIDIAKRTIEGILPNSKVRLVKKKWQDAPEILQQCDIVIGGVDSFLERQELEAECRRYLIPHIDIGMDIYKIENSYSISGQIILSMPNSCCLKCLNFLTEKKLALEALKYGDIGGNPQVVWSNGVLASMAVSVLTDLVFGWSGLENRDVYLSYDGNSGLVMEHPRLKYKPSTCEHYPISQVGPVEFVNV